MFVSYHKAKVAPEVLTAHADVDTRTNPNSVARSLAQVEAAVEAA